MAMERNSTNTTNLLQSPYFCILRVQHLVFGLFTVQWSHHRFGKYYVGLRYLGLDRSKVTISSHVLGWPSTMEKENNQIFVSLSAAYLGNAFPLLPVTPGLVPLRCVLWFRTTGSSYSPQQPYPTLPHQHYEDPPHVHASVRDCQKVRRKPYLADSMLSQK